MLKKFSLTLLFTLTFVFSYHTYAAPMSSNENLKEVNPSNIQTITVSSKISILVDHNKSTISAIDSSKNKLVWEKEFTSLFDVNFLNASNKLIILTESKNILKKLTLDINGKLLSESYFPYLKYDHNSIVSWNPNSTKFPESISILNSNQISMYKAPWKKSVWSSKVNIQPNIDFENIIVKDLSFISPYTIVQYTGSALSQSQDYYIITNTKSKKSYTINMEKNVISSYQIIGDKLIITTKQTGTNPIPTNALSKHLIFGIYQLSNGEPITKKTASFSKTANYVSWNSLYRNTGSFFYEDSVSGTWNLYDHTGKALLKSQPIPSIINHQFVNYYTLQQKALFLESDGGGKNSFLNTYTLER